MFDRDAFAKEVRLVNSQHKGRTFWKILRRLRQACPVPRAMIDSLVPLTVDPFYGNLFS